MEKQQGREGTTAPQVLPLTVNSSVDGNVSEIDVSDEERDMISPLSLARWHMAENLVEGERNKSEKEMVMSVLATALDLAKAACTLDEQKEPPEKVYIQCGGGIRIFLEPDVM